MGLDWSVGWLGGGFFLCYVLFIISFFKVPTYTGWIFVYFLVMREIGKQWGVGGLSVVGVVGGDKGWG